MKKTLAIFLVMIAFAGLLYLAAAFIVMEFNPSKWHEMGRYLLVSILVLAGVIVFQEVYKEP